MIVQLPIQRGGRDQRVERGVQNYSITRHISQLKIDGSLSWNDKFKLEREIVLIAYLTNTFVKLFEIDHNKSFPVVGCITMSDIKWSIHKKFRTDLLITFNDHSD